MEALEQRLGYRFQNKALLKTALTHSSYANEAKSGGVQCNERLEFLGDSVLGMTVAHYLYQRFSALSEGEMTKLRAELVCEQSLVRVAGRLELGQYLYLGKGEEQSGGRSRPSILADAVEAVLAAVMLDGGIGEAERLVELYILPEAETVRKRARDHKTALQELAQRKINQTLVYHMTGESGPDHQKLFTVQVCLNGQPVGTGSGRSKKEAEQAAASDALRSFEENQNA